ncbi:ABC transporter substrate-binding protein [Cellulomonas alba]|uniref:ABC transporter substrate-binding protein n=1 Tax=Cellulomonas alba TaxID=3053467 RepID=A0ABT7SD41_9CELL|nr:ABC transporter substrate-binding protein [Cellulomonas alba]MDM7853487.1 ABC transporter substrate-binding protein [Cellulomonas alba]
MRTSPLLVAGALVATLTLAACGNGSSSGSSETGSTSGKFDVSSVKKDDTIAALLPDAIKSKGTLTVGSDTTYAPAEYIAEDGKTPVGYDVDLIKAIGNVLGVKADVQTAPFTGIIPAIGSKYDVGISSFTITAEREAKANMIEYFNAGEAYAVAKGNPKKIDPNDICGKIVGVQTGTVEDDELTKVITPKCTDAGKPAPQALKYAQQSDVTTALVGGKADLMFADSPIIAYAVAQTNGKLEQLGDVFESAPQGIVTSKSDDALTGAVQKAVQKLIDDGTYGKILAAWGNEVGAVKTATLNPSAS